MLLQVPWSVGECAFHSDFRVLPLGSFDVVVGMDWLAAHSPMQIHWQDKWMTIPYQGRFTVLQGLQTATPEHLFLHIEAVQSVQSVEASQPLLPVELQSLLDDYSDLFDAPTSLPPTRACDHEIPLMPGATPVFVRLHRYPPKLKIGSRNVVSGAYSTQS